MGKIFSWQEIKEKRIPALPSFKLVADNLCCTLESCPYVIGGLIYGSYAHGTYNIRSDLDCVIVCREGSKQAVLEVLFEVITYSQSLHVPLNMNLCERVINRTNFKTVGPGFIRHVGQFIPNSIKVSPLNLVDCREAKPFDEVYWYLQHKLEQLKKGQRRLGYCTEEQKCLFLQKALEAPIHCARKILAWRGINIENDDKKNILELYGENMPTEDTNSLLSIHTLDQEYTSELLRQINFPQESNYEDLIGRIVNLIPLIREFIWINSSIVK